MNILDDALPEKFDIIFCRNLLIYFDPDKAKRLIDKLVHSLNKRGYLFTGHSEPLFGLTDDLEFVDLPGGLAYKKVTEKDSADDYIETAEKKKVSADFSIAGVN